MQQSDKYNISTVLVQLQIFIYDKSMNSIKV